MAPPNLIVIIGIGNDFRSDDGVGLAVAREFAGLNLQNVRVVEGVADGTDLLDAWNGADAACIIDCVLSGAPPGTVFRFDALLGEIPENMFGSRSTHAFSIPETVRLARTVGQLPKALIVYGVEGMRFSMGLGLSEAVRRAVCDVTGRIGNEIVQLLQSRGEPDIMKDAECLKERFGNAS